MAARTQNWLVAASVCLLLAGRSVAEEQSLSPASALPLSPANGSIFVPQAIGPHAFSANVRLEARHESVEGAQPPDVKAQEPIAKPLLTSNGEVFGAPDARVSPHLFSKGMQRASGGPFRLASLTVEAATPPVATARLQTAAVQPATEPNLSGPNKEPIKELAGVSGRGPALRLAAAQPVMRQAPTKADDRPSQLSGVRSPLQPTEVFSVSRPDFFAEEVEQAGLDLRLPRPVNLLQMEEVAAAGPMAESLKPKFQLAALQQPMPTPGAALQPAEVLPIPTPDSPATWRMPAMDQDRPIVALSTNIMTSSGTLPKDLAADMFRGDYPPWAARGYAENVYFWDAPAMCYNGLRYEEVNLERYGYGCCHVLQPFVSAAHFAGATLALPYNVVNRPPWECIYPLGHYRPGSPVPYRKIWPEWNPVAAAAECGAIAGLILLIP